MNEGTEQSPGREPGPTAADDAGAAEVESEVEVLDADGVEDPAEVVEDGAEANVGPDQDGADPDGTGESELEAARRERDEYLDLAQRARAELENYRRRTSSETAGAEQRGRAAVARDLLPAIDNLERALIAAGVAPDGDDGDAGEPPSQEVSAHTALAEGVALVYRELCAGLSRAGVESFDPTGERFDPTTSEAIATHAHETVESGAVIEVVEKGYRLGEQVLRPARVVVGG